MVRRVFAVVCLAAVAVLGAACDSPTLPLPPPQVPTIGPGSDADHVLLSSPCGGAEPNVDVLVTNTTPTVPAKDDVAATRADGCGSWSLQAYAHKNDVLDIQQISGEDTSTAVSVQVQ